MATPTLTPGFTVLSPCTATTGWSGSNTVDLEFWKYQNASLSAILRTVGANVRQFTWSGNLQNTHLRLWFAYAAPGALAVKANGGIRLHVVTTTGTLYWNIGGSDTYQGGWTMLTVDTARAADSGSGNLASVTAVGFTVTLLSAPRNATNTWWDLLAYGNGLTITGGFSGSPVTWLDIYNADKSFGYGVVQRINSVYFVNTNLIIGGAIETYVQDDNQVIVFEDQPVNANLYKIEPQGTGTTTFELTNSVVKSASTATRFDLLLNNANLNSLTFSGNSIVNADLVQFKAGQSVTGCVFQNCNQITPSTATFTGNTVAGYAGTDGALLWPGGTSVASCTFKDNSRAIEVTQTSNQTYDALSFSNNTYDTHLDNGGVSINISKNNGANPTTYIATGGGTVTYVGTSVTTRVNTSTESGSAITGAYVMLKAAATVVSGLPYNVTVTIVNSGTTATVTHNNHLLATGDKVLIEGANLVNSGVRTVSVTGANTYTYSLPASTTGTEYATQRGSVLVASDALATDYFGRGVAMNGAGNIMAVGAQLRDGLAGVNQGGVYIYDWSGSAWVQRGSVLTASDAGASDQFGQSVALNDAGSVLVVGSIGWDISGTNNEGGVYVYDWNGSAWVQRGSVLTASDAGAADYFGQSVALNDAGTVLVVGAFGWDISGTNNEGGVYIYDWSGSAWVQRGSVLTASDAGASDSFGISVALNDAGSVLVVGSIGWDISGTNNEGGVYVYDWNGSAWLQRGSVLTASDAGAADNFGVSVALNDAGTVLVVGAQLWDISGANNEGGVYTYDWNGSAWVQRGSVLTASDAGAGDQFGASVALNDAGTVLVVGAHIWDGGAADQGGVYTYDIGGAAKSTFVYLYGETDAPDGKITMSRVLPTDQAVVGWARKSTSAPYYKTGPISGTVTSANGITLTALLLSDE